MEISNFNDGKRSLDLFDFKDEACRTKIPAQSTRHAGRFSFLSVYKYIISSFPIVVLASRQKMKQKKI